MGILIGEPGGILGTSDDFLHALGVGQLIGVPGGILAALILGYC